MSSSFLRLSCLLCLCAVTAGVALLQPGHGQDDSGASADSGLLRGHLAPVLMGVFTPDGDRAVTVSSDETVRVWDLQTAQEIRRYTGHT